ncbi:hypothetical protein T552_00137 [Pneumocystis carinii B80]|uniref:Delta(14)-sterol reductase n=1 Tax=Pneumocystis carinii (strain B80) TaxID=1408658 RepID=A0A0W4ZSY2_PNEC8|nr:hypothetical protein T552_00137 [Pneumocystis carinii B80]KTW31495.1 hypothetical protein T552_00137 [Pneumocystis carinii B80]
MKMEQAKGFRVEKKSYEFGGPLGVIGIMIGTSLIVIELYLLCNENGCKLSVEGIRSSFLLLRKLWDPIAILIYTIWWILLIFCWIFIPGDIKKGNYLYNGVCLSYKMNGFYTLIFVLSCCIAGYFLKGIYFLEFVWDHYPGLITSSLIFSVLLSLYTYGCSFIPGRYLSKTGNTGNWIYDFYMGRELNPRIGTFDIKEFVELRPGIILWVIFNLTFIVHQYISLKGKITESIFLVCLFQIWYAVDSLWNEELVLTTMDIVTEGFGYMLCFGSITWVPFTYSLQARYLAFHPVYLDRIAVIGIIMLQCLGFWIFRSANLQKNTFRKNPIAPSVQHLTYITTERGTKLITNGWWGKSRHINYFGDWLMAWAWCLPTGFQSPITYFYLVFFTALLIHRERRDNHNCHLKYGKDWEKYCHMVPYRIIPYLY